MSDKALMLEILSQIREGINRVERRISGLNDADDFLRSDEGIDRLDAICMMLIAIGESAKHLDKITGGDLLARYPQVDWKGVKGIRDVISHHYFDLNAEIVYSVCKERMPLLRETIDKMIRELA